MTKQILSQNVSCVLDTAKTILYSHSHSATKTKPQQRGLKQKRLHKRVHLHSELTNISEKSSIWGPGGSTVSHLSGYFLYFFVVDAFLNPAAPQVGTNILPQTELS